MSCSRWVTASRAPLHPWPKVHHGRLHAPMHWKRLLQAWTPRLQGPAAASRQDMPPEAFIDEVEPRPSYQRAARGRPAIISISHCWRTSKIRIPTAPHFGPWVRCCESANGCEVAPRGTRTGRGSGVFLDWCSLLQKDPITDERTEEEAQLFDKALRHDAMARTSKCTSFLMVNSGDELRPHDPRGWTRLRRASPAPQPQLLQASSCREWRGRD